MKQKMDKGKKHAGKQAFQKVSLPKGKSPNEDFEKEKAIQKSKSKYSQAIEELKNK